MGYEVHITRRPNWADDSGPEITEAEWQAWLIDHPADVEVARYDQVHRGLALKSPDEAQMRRLSRIAAAFGATLQGDDGELYCLSDDGLKIFSDQDVKSPVAKICAEYFKLAAIAFAAWCAVVGAALLIWWR
jgi:hypothetical protein